MKTILLLGVLLLLVYGCTETQAGTEAAQMETEGVGAGEDACAVGEDCSMDQSYLYIPLSEITPTVKHYEYKGTGIRYFAVLAPDGTVRTAFDACGVCFKAGKGYSQAGDSVLCNNCGLKFRIADLGEKNKGAGCWPSHLPHKIENGYVMIKKSDIEGGSGLFS